MKTIEQKAEAYDEAIEKAKEYFNSPRTCFDIETLVELFPELKENEDERIRNSIIKVIKIQKQGAFGLECNHGAKWDEMIAWLEKKIV